MEVVSNVHPFLPKLTVNGQFIRDFIAAESPCFALGIAREPHTAEKTVLRWVA